MERGTGVSKKERNPPEPFLLASSSLPWAKSSAGLPGRRTPEPTVCASSSVVSAGPPLPPGPNASRAVDSRGVDLISCVVSSVRVLTELPCPSERFGVWFEVMVGEETAVVGLVVVDEPLGTLASFLWDRSPLDLALPVLGGRRSYWISPRASSTPFPL